MRGVIFGDKHTFYDWGLLLKERPNVSPPSPKTNFVKIPGSNRVIDLTESLTGSVKYDPRTIDMRFLLVSPRVDWASNYETILNAIHGKRLKIVLDDDPDFYYMGRVTVGDLDAGKTSAEIAVEAEVEPYKYARYGSGVKL